MDKEKEELRAKLEKEKAEMKGKLERENAELKAALEKERKGLKDNIDGNLHEANRKSNEMAAKLNKLVIVGNGSTYEYISCICMF